MATPVTSDQLLSSLRQIRADVEVRYPIRLIGLIGSAARDELREDSDIDVLAEYRPGLSLTKLGAVHLLLAERLGRGVDIVLEEGLTPGVRRRVMRDLRRI